MVVTGALQSLSSYPVPPITLTNIAEEAGLDPKAQITPELRKSREFKKACGMVYLFLSDAPNVSQAGISFSLSAEERERLKKRGEGILEEIGEADINGMAYGYMGEDL